MRIAVVAGLVWAVLLGSARGAEVTHVSVGMTNSATDVGFFIADHRHYFSDEGIAVDFITFDSAARMIAQFGAHNLDVGAGGLSAGLYNAVARRVDIRIVADKNSTPLGRPSQKLLIRRDLVDSGRYKNLADLRGMKLATSAPGSAAMGTIVKIIAAAGLAPDDINEVYMSFSQMVIALENKAVDAVFPAEPQATQAIAGGAYLALSDDQIYPNHQISAVLYAGSFIEKNPDVARRFLKAYLRGVRDHNDALVDGRLSGPQGDDVVSILTQYSLVKDPAVHRSFVLSAINPDGKVDLASMKEDLSIFKKAGLIEGKVEVEQAVDLSFLNAVIAELGPYQRHHHL